MFINISNYKVVMNETLKFGLMIFIPVFLISSIAYYYYYHSNHTEVCMIVFKGGNEIFMTGEDLKQMYDEYKSNYDPNSIEEPFLRSIDILNCKYYKNEEIEDLPIISYEPKKSVSNPVVIPSYPSSY